MGDLTASANLGLPALGPALAQSPTYSGGLTGLGQAECPSTEQLQGVIDMNDPCQSGVSTLPLGTTSGPTASVLNQPLLPSPGTPAYSQLMASLPVNPPTQISGTTLLIGGGILLLVVLMGMARR